MDGMTEMEQDSAVAEEAMSKWMKDEIEHSFDLVSIEGDGKPERRWAIATMRYSCLIDVFNWFLNPSEPITIPYESVGLPRDCRVERVVMNEYRDCIDLFLSHPSFAVVPEACEVPRLNNAFHFKVLTLIKDSEVNLGQIPSEDAS